MVRGSQRLPIDLTFGPREHGIGGPSRTPEWSSPPQVSSSDGVRPVRWRDRELARAPTRGSVSTSSAWRASPQPRSAAGARRRAARSPRRGRAAPGRAASGGPGRRRATAPARGGRPTPPRPRGTARPGDERPEQVELGAEGDDGRRLGPVAGDQPSRGLRSDRRGPPGSVDSSPAIRASASGRRRRPAVARPCRWGGARRFAPEDRVDDVARHDPVGRVLAAADPDDAVRLDRHAVLARRLDRRAVGRRDERPQPGVRADDIVPRQVDVHRRVDRVEQLVDLPAGRRRVARPGPRTARRSCRSASGPATGRGRRSCPGPGWSARSVFGIRSRGTTRWAPRLGRIRSEPPPNGWSGSAAQTPVASTTARVRISKVAPVSRSSARNAPRSRRLVESARRPVARTRVTRHAAGGDRRASHGERVARVVLDPVVVEQAAAQPVVLEGRGQVERVCPRQPAVPAAVVSRPEDVVQRQTRVVERLRGERDAVDREQQRLDRTRCGASVSSRDRSASASRTSPKRNCSR